MIPFCETLTPSGAIDPSFAQGVTRRCAHPALTGGAEDRRAVFLRRSAPADAVAKL